MSDDICQCFVESSELLQMRRLLSWLRQSQDFCTDTECIELPSGPTPSADNGLFMMGCIILFAVIMYFLRPKSLRGRNSTNGKPSRSNGSDDNNPQPPPPQIN